jgi:teichuronic acid biosynthesis glycosyltransferase TuaG
MNKSNELVSIIMPSFNSADYISESVDSVLAQSYENWELVIADGGSNDISQRLLDKLEATDPRIRTIRNSSDKGPADARSIGIRAAAGKYIAFLDADDVWEKNKLQKQINFMQKEECRFSFTQVRLLDVHNKLSEKSLKCAKSNTFSQYLRRRGVANSSVIVTRELLTEEILACTYNGLGEDTLWWLLIMRQGVTARLLAEPLLQYRQTKNSRSSQVISNQLAVWELYRGELGLGLTTASISYLGYVLDVVIRRLRFSFT